MKNIVRMDMEEGALLLTTRVHVASRIASPALARALVLDGIGRVTAQSPYWVDGVLLPVRCRVEFSDTFALDAVNVRVQDKPLVRRHGLMRLFNTVSRAYFGARRVGILKLTRFLMRMPDVFINLGGKDMGDPLQYAVMASVVEHEFAHVWGCRDQYRYRNDQRRGPDVEDGDLMYRVGAKQRLQPYHIKGFCKCALRGKLPIRRI